jgi:hypothetical protein
METIKTVRGRKPKGSSINFVVEKNVKIFKSLRKSKPDSIYPYHKMNVGDSFEFPSSMNSRIVASSSYHSKKYGIKFFVAKQDNEKHRIWRVK